ncbi:hypothetical protein SAMN05216266_12865 [Amycolatopsis marina]|uniref:Uncharacterized protein n=1 Tax=Amycolatopsis marina TaxID=490629 RepID=A0A1I1CGA6_9PSEU|nr:hypothetical protein [Amycolatopsis marina]SFB61669.1 hypothetical protein SAMN05216266_12865 [Amycolatopsis marina]
MQLQLYLSRNLAFLTAAATSAAPFTALTTSTVSLRATDANE